MSEHDRKRATGTDEVRLRVAVLMASFNRCTSTLACLSALMAGRIDALELRVVLVDDGSTDGTADAVTSEFPAVDVLRGEGGLYWNRAMHRAFGHAMSTADLYLWLNDDTILERDALERMVATWRAISSRERRSVIVVGATRDAVTGRPTYGGARRRSAWRPTKFDPVTPTDEAQPVDVMNGNCVLIPAEVARVVGNMDPAFEHAMGDTDYALRARRAGFGVWLAPGFVGTCSNNARQRTFDDRDLPLAMRWRHMMSPKGLPWRSWLVFTRRHAGVAWPIFWAWPYVRVVVESLVGSPRRPRSHERGT